MLVIYADGSEKNVKPGSKRVGKEPISFELTKKDIPKDGNLEPLVEWLKSVALPALVAK